MPLNGFKEAADVIVSHFLTEFRALHSGFIITLRGEPFTAPDKEDYIRFSVLYSDSTIASKGDQPLWRRFGTVSAALFTERGKGAAEHDALIDDIKNVLEGKNISGVQMRETIPLAVGPEGNHEHTNVITEFQYDERHS